jgi:Na+-translocating ferredoxin:NAD+ oxidoreductase RNF subunit RnfB
MGLPNIRKNTDRFDIQSTVGEGTRVSFTVFLNPQQASGPARSSVQVRGELCRECLRCLRACPTKALRVRGGPDILEHLCIDCTVCIDACKTGALTMMGTTPIAELTPGARLVVPPQFLVQFGGAIGPHRVIAALKAMGFADVVVTAPWERVLREAVVKYAQEEAKSTPVISPCCPAVVNLIEMRFPSLIGSVAPFVSAIEAVQQELSGRQVVFVATCPSQYTALTARRSSARAEIVAVSSFRQAVMPHLIATKDYPEMGSDGPHAGVAGDPDVAQVSGMGHVMAALEAAENGLLGDVCVLELFACDQGCFGSPLLSEDAYIARRRWERSALGGDATAKAVRRTAPLAARAGLRLDADMSKAIEKLSRIGEIIRGLPGRDCGVCGSPTCATLAEDIVLGRTTIAACVHHSNRQEDTK